MSQKISFFFRILSHVALAFPNLLDATQFCQDRFVLFLPICVGISPIEDVIEANEHIPERNAKEPRNITC